jgi:hypothetical protein
VNTKASHHHTPDPTPAATWADLTPEARNLVLVVAEAAATPFTVQAVREHREELRTHRLVRWNRRNGNLQLNRAGRRVAEYGLGVS